MGDNRRRRGFTLVELAVVVSIIAVMAQMAIPRYGRAISNYRAEAAARRIAADIGVAQARARALSSSQSIVFSVNGNSYQITGMSDPDRPGTTYTVGLSDQTTGSVVSAAAFGNSSTLTFNGYGVPTSGGTVTVVSGTATRRVTVSADTGAVQVQ
jgi:prepilin-type N-terminal cleavage/methylation domain-containing protein